MKSLVLTFLLSLLCHGEKLLDSPFPKIKYVTKYPMYLSNMDMVAPVEPIEDFCAPNLCPENKKHVACNPKFWGDACPKKRKGYDMNWYQQYIIDEHIKWIKYFKRLSAVILEWDEALSKLAIRVVNRCEPNGKDDCANTSFFPRVSIHKYEESVIKNDVLISITTGIVIALFQFDEYVGHNIPNFNYTNGLYVGCGMIDYEKKTVFYRYMACIYSEGVYTE